MGARDEFRAALEDGDFRQLRRISEVQEPHLPRLTDEDAEKVMHMTRTGMETLALKLRAWSHRWLTERGLESRLPDELRPSAERLYPKVALAVGIAVRSSPDLAPAALEIRRSMEDAVLDAEAHGRLADSDFVRARMLEARSQTRKKLFGSSFLGGR